MNYASNTTNEQVNGFSSLYFNSTISIAVPTQTGQIWCGQNNGLNIGTSIAYPIRFSANRFATGVVNSIEILGTGTRDVEISEPLLVKGASATFNSGVKIRGALVVGTTNVINATDSIEQNFLIS